MLNHSGEWHLPFPLPRLEEADRFGSATRLRHSFCSTWSGLVGVVDPRSLNGAHARNCSLRAGGRPGCPSSRTSGTFDVDLAPNLLRKGPCRSLPTLMEPFRRPNRPRPSIRSTTPRPQHHPYRRNRPRRISLRSLLLRPTAHDRATCPRAIDQASQCGLTLLHIQSSSSSMMT